MTRFRHIRTNACTVPTYELTMDVSPDVAADAGMGVGPGGGAYPSGGACTDAGRALQAAQPPLYPTMHDPRKRKNSQYSSTKTTNDDDGTEDTRSTHTIPDKKYLLSDNRNRQNHSEIEKRRRDKMNTYITELSAMIPMCGAMARKLDKLTVLRMAVQHLRTIRGALSTCPLTNRPRPSHLSERELNSLVVQAAQDCFLLVVGCDRGRLLYVSASVKKILQYDQSELLGQSLFDILHPKDVAKVKEQLSSSDLSPREKLIDAKTMLPVKTDVVAGESRLCPGSRRSFFCRIKSRVPDVNGNANIAAASPTDDPEAKMRKKHNSEKKYCVVQCTGYLKSRAPAEMCNGNVEADGDDSDACNLSCLVAVGRALPDLAAPPISVAAPPAPHTAPPTRLLQYVSRHATDGKFLFVDQRVTLALGFLPQELLGTSLYEYVDGEELSAVAQAHKAALLRRAPLHTPQYSFRRKDGSYTRLQTHFKPFRNPWTKDVEYLVANNTVVAKSMRAADPGESQESLELFKHKADGEMQRLIDSQVESHKIGSTIAEEALTRSSSDFSPDLSADLLHDVASLKPSLSLNVMYEQASLVDSIFGTDQSYQVRNDVPLSLAGAQSPPTGIGVSGDLSATPPSDSPPLPPLGLDGNREAAIAVIMSLLEADAGLGGPVNFSGLP